MSCGGSQRGKQSSKNKVVVNLCLRLTYRGTDSDARSVIFGPQALKCPGLV